MPGANQALQGAAKAASSAVVAESCAAANVGKAVDAGLSIMLGSLLRVTTMVDHLREQHQLQQEKKPQKRFRREMMKELRVRLAYRFVDVEEELGEQQEAEHRNQEELKRLGEWPSELWLAEEERQQQQRDRRPTTPSSSSVPALASGQVSRPVARVASPGRCRQLQSFSRTRVGATAATTATASLGDVPLESETVERAVRGKRRKRGKRGKRGNRKRDDREGESDGRPDLGISVERDVGGRSLHGRCLEGQGGRQLNRGGAPQADASVGVGTGAAATSFGAHGQQANAVVEAVAAVAVAGVQAQPKAPAKAAPEKVRKWFLRSKNGKCFCTSKKKTFFRLKVVPGRRLLWSSIIGECRLH